MCITEYDEVRTMNLFKEEGREEGTKEMSLNLYRLGISIENIAAGANVSVDQVRS
ncbi:MAG: hypothetical protein IJI57_11085 [Flexilinea sp.]|nr:hypothetical protein [Flexilinea sp.]